MLVTLEGMTMVEREPQSLNAQPPMLVTLEGITTSDRELQPENVQSPMLVTLVGKTILDRELQHENCMHGGEYGFDKRLFSAVVNNELNTVTFYYESFDGEEGFPGNLKFFSSYQLTDENKIIISHVGFSDKDTVLNITNHSYFNLDGHDRGTIENHKLKIYADCFLELSKDCCPNGKILDVNSTPMDFRRAKRIGEHIESKDEQLLISEGYDHNWNITNWDGTEKKMAELESSDGVVRLMVSSDLPGLQMYSGNYLDGSEAGKGGTKYGRRNGVCLEAQFYPAAPEFSNFPSAELKKGDVYSHRIIFAFAFPVSSGL